MSAEPTIDPEVVSLLREAASSPDSRLLQVPRTGFSSWLRRREPPLSPREPFLSRAERYLLQEHREQVAYLLYKACQRAILERPPSESMVYRNASPGLEIRLPGPEWWTRETGSASRAMPADGEAMRELFALAEELRPQPAKRLSASELAAASLRIVHRDETRIWLGMALLHESKTKEARGSLEAVIYHLPSELNASLAWQDLGWMHYVGGDYSSAMDCYREASLVGPPRITPVLAWLHVAFCAGEREAVSLAAGRLAELDPMGSRDVNECIAMWEGRRRSGSFRPSAQSRSLAMEVVDVLPTAAARIAHVFFQPI